MSEIAPLSVLSVQDIIRRKDDLVISVDDIKAMAKRERYDTIDEVLKNYKGTDEEFRQWLMGMKRSLT